MSSSTQRIETQRHQEDQQRAKKTEMPSRSMREREKSTLDEIEQREYQRQHTHLKFVRSVVKIEEPAKFNKKWVFPLSYQSADIDGQMVVKRRYSHFKLLRSQLHTKFPGSILPILPGKDARMIASNLNMISLSPESELLQFRRRTLLHFLTVVLSNPTLGESEDVQNFLTLEISQYDNLKTKSQIPTTIRSMVQNLTSKLGIRRHIHNEREEEINKIVSCLNDLRSNGVELVRRHEDLGDSFGNLGATCSKLSSCGATQMLDQKLSSVRALTTKASEDLKSLSTEESRDFVELITFYCNWCKSAKDELQSIETLKHTQEAVEKRIEQLQRGLLEGEQKLRDISEESGREKWNSRAHQMNEKLEDLKESFEKNSNNYTVANCRFCSDFEFFKKFLVEDIDFILSLLCRNITLSAEKQNEIWRSAKDRLSECRPVEKNITYPKQGGEPSRETSGKNLPRHLVQPQMSEQRQPKQGQQTTIAAPQQPVGVVVKQERIVAPAGQVGSTSARERQPQMSEQRQPTPEGPTQPVHGDDLGQEGQFRTVLSQGSQNIPEHSKGMTSNQPPLRPSPASNEMNLRSSVQNEIHGD